MVTLDLNKNYSRYNKILYENDIPIINLEGSNFVDWGPLAEFSPKTYLSVTGVKYMQKYINANNLKIMEQNKKVQILRFFYDTETTGTDYKRNSIHQLTGWIEIDGVVIERLNLFIKPHPKAVIEQEALNIAKVTEEQIQAYPSMEEQFQTLVSTLKKYVDPFGKVKFFMIGFKNASFDDDFLKKYFELMGSKFFLYFYASSIDVSCLAAEYLIKIRHTMPSFKLKRVAKTLGILVDEEKLHDADYDVFLTREIYYIVTSLKEESLY
jgi:DNA polymerase-3 subunit epsilon